VPDVSIAMPIGGYNGEFIGAALQSIYRQSFADFELLPVLDGPPDDCTREALATLPADVIIREHCAQHGTAIALNTAFAHATGEFWTWVSDDNEMASEWLATLVHFMRTHPHLVGCYAAFEYRRGRIVDDTWQTEWTRHIFAGQPRSPSWMLDMALSGCRLGPAFLWRADACRRIGEHRGKIAHDYDYWLRLEEVGPLAGVDELLCIYNSHGANASATRAAEFDAPQWAEDAARRRGLVST
jgi:glycosyltransferase involved in cell wall biosynthesis